MALILECGTDGLKDCVADVGRGVDEMEVFSTRFADDAREGFVAVDVSPDVLPKFLDDKCGSCKVEGGKVGVSEDVLDGLCRWAWYELDDLGREAGFEQDLMDEVVRIGDRRRGFPYYDVANKGGCTREVADDGGEVGKNEAFQRAILYAAMNEFCKRASIYARKTLHRSISRRLLRIQLFNKLDTKAKKGLKARLQCQFPPVRHSCLGRA